MAVAAPDERGAAALGDAVLTSAAVAAPRANKKLSSRNLLIFVHIKQDFLFTDFISYCFTQEHRESSRTGNLKSSYDWRLDFVLQQV